uniref:Uncharacterized protein n=1 Tax=Romanomermis culicivorax TaxID=13658 RepID=A0A915L9V7_ROMCU
MDGRQYLSSVENQAQLEDILIAQNEQNVYDNACISEYMDAEGSKKKEDDHTAVAPIHTVVETPQELAHWLAGEEEEIQVSALTWDTGGLPGNYTAEAIKNMKEKGFWLTQKRNKKQKAIRRR